jgi:hypothetical protein
MLVQVVADDVAEPALAMGRDDIEGHVLQLEPGMPRPAVAPDPVGLAPQEALISLNRWI